MKKTLWSTRTILVLALFSVVFLTYLGCNTASMDEDTHGGSSADSEMHDHDTSTEPSLNDSLNTRIDAILADIQKSMAEGGMPKGIFELRQLAAENPDNARLNYEMGLLSLQSGQYDLAVKRFEKLVSLHPENEDYQKLLEEAKSKR